MINIQNITDEMLYKVINGSQDIAWNFYALKVMIMRLRLKLSMTVNSKEAEQQCYAELRELFRKSCNIPSAKKDLQIIMEQFGEN